MRSSIRRGDWQPRHAILFLAVSFAFILLLRGIELYVRHSTNSMDGALQTWFAVDHFARGAKLGTDFQSYLGVTSMMSLVPAFELLGSNLWASTMAAYIMVSLAHGITVFVLLRMVRWVPFYWCLVVTGLVFVALNFGDARRLVEPMYSLRPLRWGLPFILALIAWPQLRRALTGQVVVPGIVIGAASGIGLWWSNDAGIPAVAAMTGALVACLWGRWKDMARLLAVYVSALGVSALVVLFAVTHGDPIPWLQYNFGAVRGDQSWYFGPWGRETRILHPAEISHIFSEMSLMDIQSLLLILAAVTVAGFKRLRGQSAPVRSSLFLMVCLSTVGSALIPQIGGHVEDGYNRAMWIPAIGALFYLAGPAGLSLARRAAALFTKGRGKAWAVVALAIMLAGEAFATGIWVRDNGHNIEIAELGARFDPDYVAEVEGMRRQVDRWEAQGIAADRRLLSVYTPVMKLAAGDRLKHPTPYGSMIHALGTKGRTEFTRLVERREVAGVTTISPDYNAWALWNVRANWPFFRALFKGYEPVAANDQQVLWLRTTEADAQAGGEPLDCTIGRDSDGRHFVEVEGRAGRYASLDIDLAFDGEKPFLVAEEQSHEVEDVQRRPGWTGGPQYGLPPTRSQELMLAVGPGKPSRLTIERYDDGTLSITFCRALALDAPRLDNLTSFADYYPR